MGILSGYLMRTILVSTLLVLMVLLALATLFEFIGELHSPETPIFGLWSLPSTVFPTACRTSPNRTSGRAQ